MLSGRRFAVNPDSRRTAELSPEMTHRSHAPTRHSTLDAGCIMPRAHQREVEILLDYVSGRSQRSAAPINYWGT